MLHTFATKRRSQQKNCCFFATLICDPFELSSESGGSLSEVESLGTEQNRPAMPSSPSDSDHRDVIKMPQLQASSDRALAEKLSSSPSPASFKAPFDWMFASACTGRTLTEIQWMNKDEAIRATLAGNEQGVVDLWRLRELSLSPGGLLSPSLRKRAWPMLTGCHEQILQAAAGALKPSTFATPSFHDMISLKNDVSKTIWNVEEHLIASREEQRLVDEELQYYRSLLRYASKKVSFAPILTSSSPDSSPRDDNREYESDVGGPPDTIFTSTTSEDEIDLDVESVTSSEDAGISPVETTGFSSPVNRWREASDHEQKILYNVILSVLRTEPEPSEYFEDDQYRVRVEVHEMGTRNLHLTFIVYPVLSRIAGSVCTHDDQSGIAIVDEPRFGEPSSDPPSRFAP